MVRTLIHVQYKYFPCRLHYDLPFQPHFTTFYPTPYKCHSYIHFTIVLSYDTALV